MQINMKEVFDRVVISKACSIKADKDSQVSKTVTLNVVYEGVTLQDVFQKSMNTTVISWQNGQGRKHFDDWVNGQVIEVMFRAPGRTQVDAEQAMLAKFAGMDQAGQEKFMLELMATAKETPKPMDEQD